MFFPSGSVVKNMTASAGEAGSVPRSRRCPGEGNCNPLCMLAWRTPTGRGTCGLQSTGSQKSRTRPKRLNNKVVLTVWSPNRQHPHHATCQKCKSRPTESEIPGVEPRRLCTANLQVILVNA